MSEGRDFLVERLECLVWSLLYSVEKKSIKKELSKKIRERMPGLFKEPVLRFAMNCVAIRQGVDGHLSDEQYRQFIENMGEVNQGLIMREDHITDYLNSLQCGAKCKISLAHEGLPLLLDMVALFFIKSYVEQQTLSESTYKTLVEGRTPYTVQVGDRSEFINIKNASSLFQDKEEIAKSKRNFAIDSIVDLIKMKIKMLATKVISIEDV